MAPAMWLSAMPFEEPKQIFSYVMMQPEHSACYVQTHTPTEHPSTVHQIKNMNGYEQLPREWHFASPRPELGSVWELSGSEEQGNSKRQLGAHVQLDLLCHTWAFV